MNRKLVRSVLVASLIFGGGAIGTSSASAVTTAEGGGAIATNPITNYLSNNTFGSNIPSVGGAIASIGIAGARAIAVIGWCTIVGC